MSGWVTAGRRDDETADGPPRWERPINEVPGAVELAAVLARTDDVAVFLSAMCAYTTGVGFTIDVRTRNAAADPDHDLGALVSRRRRELLLGVEFADGRACTLRGDTPLDRPPSAAEPLLSDRGGGGSARHAHVDLFLWPLPPPGDLRIVCAWPQRGIPETVTVVSADRILEAAERVQELWPWEPEPRFDELTPEPEMPEGSWFAARRGVSAAPPPDDAEDRG